MGGQPQKEKPLETAATVIFSSQVAQKWGHNVALQQFSLI